MLKTPHLSKRVQFETAYKIVSIVLVEKLYMVISLNVCLYWLSPLLCCRTGTTRGYLEAGSVILIAVISQHLLGSVFAQLSDGHIYGCLSLSFLTTQTSTIDRKLLRSCLSWRMSYALHYIVNKLIYMSVCVLKCNWRRRRAASNWSYIFWSWLAYVVKMRYSGNLYIA